MWAGFGSDAERIKRAVSVMREGLLTRGRSVISRALTVPNTARWKAAMTTDAGMEGAARRGLCPPPVEDVPVHRAVSWLWGDMNREAANQVSVQRTNFGRTTKDQGCGARTGTGCGANDLAFARGLLRLGDAHGNLAIQHKDLPLKEAGASRVWRITTVVPCPWPRVRAVINAARAICKSLSSGALSADRRIRHKRECSSHVA